MVALGGVLRGAVDREHDALGVGLGGALHAVAHEGGREERHRALELPEALHRDYRWQRGQ